MRQAKVDGAEAKYPASDKGGSRPRRIPGCQRRADECSGCCHDELCAESAQYTDEDRNSKTEDERRCIESWQPEDGKDEIDGGKCRGTRTSAAVPQNCYAPCDHPEGCDIGKHRTTRNVVTKGLDRLMGRVKITPDEVQDAPSDCRQAVQVDAESLHLQFALRNRKDISDTLVQWIDPF